MEEGAENEIDDFLDGDYYYEEEDDEDEIYDDMDEVEVSFLFTAYFFRPPGADAIKQFTPSLGIPYLGV